MPFEICLGGHNLDITFACSSNRCRWGLCQQIQLHIQAGIHVCLHKASFFFPKGYVCPTAEKGTSVVVPAPVLTYTHIFLLFQSFNLYYPSAITSKLCDVRARGANALRSYFVFFCCGKVGSLVEGARINLGVLGNLPR